MKESFLVSIVIPVHNCENFISRTLKSVVKQNFKDWECIIVDDGSIDDTVIEIKEWIKDDSRFRLIELEGFSNANVARNIGIKASKGLYIAMLDADDEFCPEHIETRVKKIKSTGADGIYGGMVIDNGINRKVKFARSLFKNETPADYVFSGGISPTPTHFYKKEAILNILWNEGIKRHQDFDLFIRFMKRYKFIADPKPTVTVHWELGKKRNINFAECRKVYRIYENELNKQSKKEYLYNMLILSVKQRDCKNYNYYKKELRNFPGVLSFKKKILSFNYNLTNVLIKLSRSFGKLQFN